MRHTPALAVVGLVSCMTLGACSGNEPAATPPASPTPSSSSSATPTPIEPPQSSDEPVQEDEPKLPELAMEHSQAGARAFIEHYLSVLNTAYLETEPGLVRPYTPKNCDLCVSFLRVLKRVNKLGGSQSGGAWTPTRVDLATRESADRLIYIASVDIAKGRSRGSSGAAPEAIVADQIQLEIRLLWSRELWMLTDVRPL